MGKRQVLLTARHVTIAVVPVAAPLCLVMLAALLLTGCSCSPFDAPDSSIRAAAVPPKESEAIRSRFDLSARITDVYYFSSNRLRCDTYLRGKVDPQEAAKYEKRILEFSGVERVQNIPADLIGETDLAAIRDWWPAGEKLGRHVYRLGTATIDYVMVDPDEGLIYLLWGGD